MGHDDERRASRWKVLGGEGAEIDHEFESRKEFNDLLKLLKSLCARFLDCVESDPFVTSLIVSLMCNFGKHRSRWLVKELEDWLADTYPNSDSWIHVEYLSEDNRRQELAQYY